MPHLAGPSVRRWAEARVQVVQVPLVIGEVAMGRNALTRLSPRRKRGIKAGIRDDGKEDHPRVFVAITLANYVATMMT